MTAYLHAPRAAGASRVPQQRAGTRHATRARASQPPATARASITSTSTNNSHRPPGRPGRTWPPLAAHRARRAAPASRRRRVASRWDSIARVANASDSGGPLNSNRPRLCWQNQAPPRNHPISGSSPRTLAASWNASLAAPPPSEVPLDELNDGQSAPEAHRCSREALGGLPEVVSLRRLRLGGCLIKTIYPFAAHRCSTVPRPVQR